MIRVTVENVNENGVVVNGKTTSDDGWFDAIAGQANDPWTSLRLAVKVIIKIVDYELDTIVGRQMTGEEDQRMMACFAWVNAMPLSSGEAKEVEEVRKYYQSIKDATQEETDE